MSDGCSKLFVGGLQGHTTTDSLRAHFEQYGPLCDAIVMMSKETGQSRRYHSGIRCTGVRSLRFGVLRIVQVWVRHLR
jgi:hypothetical protein